MPAPTTIAGILDIADSENTYVNQVGQTHVYDAIGEYTARLNTNLNLITGLFVEKTTTNVQWTYHLPGNRQLQRQGGMARAGEQKFKASYGVALPIFQFGDALGGDWINMAYMTIADVDRQVDEIKLGARRLLRKEVLIAMFNNADLSFDDLKWDTLTIRGLANGDATYYPPLPGVDDLATANHYGKTNYAVSAIDDDHDPIKWHADKIKARFPDEIDGLVFISSNMTPYVKELTDFLEVGDPRISKGGLADRLNDLPGGLPGRVIGRAHEVWIVEWADVPSNYSVSIAPSYEKPLQKRIDIPEANLPSDLTLIKVSDKFPLEKSDWVWRFGLGVVNRLNGFVLECGVGETYTVPASLAR